MFDPTDLYRLAEDLPELTDPVLLYHFDGFVDAGAAGRLALRHVLDELEHRVVATFDVDRLLDYRSRRPIMVFDTDRWVEVETPELVVYSVKDATGTPFLLMTGPEPDRAWELFIRAVGTLVQPVRREQDGDHARHPDGRAAHPPAGPHHARQLSPELMSGKPSTFGRVQVPGSVAALMEFRLGAEGRDAIGFAVHVPHYLSQAEYPTAAVAALEAVTRNTGLMFPLDALREAAERTTVEIEEQISSSAELSSAISGLEQQYDAFAVGEERENLIAESIPMPTGDELAAQFERFLAERDDD
ncbi:PAC2 family protein [Nonomuraea ferruginea]